MSVAAAGGGMGGSDDESGGHKKQKGILDIPHSPLSSSDEDSDEGDETMAADRRKSKLRSCFPSMHSLDVFLPRKRSISIHYHGKSKSFGNLRGLGIEDSKDLEKMEHPVNKRRRLLIAHEIRDQELGGQSSSKIPHAASLPACLPRHRQNEDDDEEGDQSDEKKGSGHENEEDDDGK